MSPVPVPSEAVMDGLPTGRRAPRYGTATLCEVLPSVAALLGVPAYDDVLGLGPHLTGVRRVVVLLVDGLGQHNLFAALAGPEGPRRYPTLAALADPLGGLDAVAPTTTPANLASLSTGAPPGAHGIIGFTVVVPGGGERRLTHVAWPADGPDPRTWQPLSSVLADGGPAATAVVGPATFLGSGLTRAIHRDVDYRGTYGAGDLVATTVAAVRSAPRTLTYAYHGDLDAIGHVRGWEHPSWAAALAQVDALVAGLLAGLSADAALLLTADHGMRSVRAEDKVDLDAADGAAGGLAQELGRAGAGPPKRTNGCAHRRSRPRAHP